MKKTTTLLVSGIFALSALSANAQEGDRAALLDKLTEGLAIPAGHPAAITKPQLAPPTEPDRAGELAEGAKTAPIAAPSAAHSDVAPLKAPTATRRPAPEAAERKIASLKKGKGKTPLKALKDQQEDTGPSLGYMFVGVLLIGLAGVAVWLKRRAVRQNPWADSATIETLATHRVTPKHQVTLIKVPGRVLVVGIAEKGMTLLTEMDESELNQASAPNIRSLDEPQSPGNFVQRLSRMTGGWRKEAARGPDPFQEALAEDAPVDELVRLEERAAIRERLEALRRRTVA